MSNLDENFEVEKLQIRKLFVRTLIIIVICTIIALIGYFFHSIDVFGFFMMLTSLSFMFMVLIGAERLEIHNRYNGKYKIE